jgi:hypothetical protein
MAIAEGTRLDQALDGMRAMLAADGYVLHWSVEGDVLAVSVVATGDACADCLVPKTLFSALVRDALQKHEIVIDEGSVHLTYPAETTL